MPTALFGMALQAAMSPRPSPPPPPLEPCAFDQPAREAPSLRALPAPMQGELRRFFKPGFYLADAGEPFSRTDVVIEGRPSRRFLRAYGIGDRWIIWYEHGGLGYHLHATGVSWSGADRPARILPNALFTGYSSADLCKASRAFFDGVQTASDN